MEYTGRIIKGVGSFYTLLTDNGEFVCKARGRFRKEGITPVPGDYCRFETGDDGKGCITEILTRKNLLIRPAAANIDKLMIVLSSSLPRPDYCLADKLIMQCELSDITPVILLNKCDEMDRETYEAALAQYKDTGYDIIPVSARDGHGDRPAQSRDSGQYMLLCRPVGCWKVFAYERSRAGAGAAGGPTVRQDRPRQAYHPSCPAMAGVRGMYAGYARVQSAGYGGDRSGKALPALS